MPIRIEQPQPLAPQVSSFYGGAEAQLRGNAAVLQAGTETARMQAQIAQQNLARRQQAALQSAALQQRATEAAYGNAQVGNALEAQVGMKNADRELGRQELDGRLKVSARDVFQAQAEQNQIERRGQVQAYLQDRDLSYQEQLRLKKMEEAVSTVANDSTLDPETKNDLILQLKTNIDPMRARMESARAKGMQQQQQALAQQQELLTALQSGDQARKTAAIAKFAVPLPNPYTGQMEPFYATPDGELKPIPFQGKPEKPAGQTDQFGRTSDQVVKAVQDAQKRVDSYIDDKQQAAKKEKPDDPVPQFDREKLLEQELAQQEAYLAKMIPGAAGSQQPPPGLSPAQREENRPAVTGEPFNRHDPKTYEKNPEARRLVADFAGQMQALQARPDLYQEEKAPILRAYDEALRLLEKGQLTDAEWAEYEKLIQTKVPKPRTQPAPPVAPPRVRPGSFVR